MFVPAILYSPFHVKLNFCCFLYLCKHFICFWDICSLYATLH